jgi:glycosyltransferase involved in cell wall biosynthesis
LTKDRPKIFSGNIYAAIVPWMISFIVPINYHVYCYGTELFPLKNPHSIKASLWKSILRRAETIYYLTNATLDILRENYGSGPYQQMVPKINLKNIVFHPEKHDDESISILSVGRLVPHKGHLILIDAIAALQKTLPWHLTIIGNGPEFKHLNKAILQKDITDKVSIETEITDENLYFYYKNAHIFVLPSIETSSAIEGFGIVLLEAMAYGAAIIASRSGGVGEVVQNSNRFAEIIEPGIPKALTNALQNLCHNKNRRKEMVLAAYQLVKEHYAW